MTKTKSRVVCMCTSCF